MAKKAKPQKASDVQFGGNHYNKKGSHQPWDQAKAYLSPEEYRGAMKFSAIVYLQREEDKAGDEDVAKAGHYIQKMIEECGRDANGQCYYKNPIVPQKTKIQMGNADDLEATGSTIKRKKRKKGRITRNKKS